MSPAVDAWLTALLERHQSRFTRPELLKAIRALSARYVEQRHALDRRSPLDSAGKRAAFAAFYAPLHFITVDLVVRRLRLDTENPPHTIVDLGCGTGVAGAAWALAANRARIEGVDRDAWAIGEARWNWARLGVDGRARRADLVDDLASRTRRQARRHTLASTGIVCGWSVNELDAPSRSRLLPLLAAAATRGARVLVVEPIAGAATPWWPEWQRLLPDSRSDEWHFTEVPSQLQALSDEAGFRREVITAKSLSVSHKP
jgi:hypothetical protein